MVIGGGVPSWTKSIPGPKYTYSTDCTSPSRWLEQGIEKTKNADGGEGFLEGCLETAYGSSCICPSIDCLYTLQNFKEFPPTTSEVKLHCTSQDHPANLGVGDLSIQDEIRPWDSFGHRQDLHVSPCWLGFCPTVTSFIFIASLKSRFLYTCFYPRKYGIKTHAFKRRCIIFGTGIVRRYDFCIFVRGSGCFWDLGFATCRVSPNLWPLSHAQPVGPFGWFSEQSRRGWKERQPVYSIRGRGEDSEKVRRSRSAPMMLGGWVNLGEWLWVCWKHADLSQMHGNSYLCIWVCPTRNKKSKTSTGLVNAIYEYMMPPTQKTNSSAFGASSGIRVVMSSNDFLQVMRWLRKTAVGAINVSLICWNCNGK